MTSQDMQPNTELGWTPGKAWAPGALPKGRQWEGKQGTADRNGRGIKVPPPLASGLYKVGFGIYEVQSKTAQQMPTQVICLARHVPLLVRGKKKKQKEKETNPHNSSEIDESVAQGNAWHRRG